LHYENVFKRVEIDFSILETVFMIHIQKVRCQQNFANLGYFWIRCEDTTNPENLFPHRFKNRTAEFLESFLVFIELFLKSAHSKNRDAQIKFAAETRRAPNTPQQHGKALTS